MALSGMVEEIKGTYGVRLRRRLDAGLERLGNGAWPVVQTAMAASLAWYMTAMILGNERPVIAAIAAVICVGALSGQTVRRAAEWILGVAVGLTVADAIMFFIGTGPVQTGVMVAFAMAAALVIRSGIMFVTEAGVSAILVATLDPSTSGISPDRFLEALVGGGAALVVSAIVPNDPKARVGRASRRILRELVTVHHDVAEALRSVDAELAGTALEEARGLDGRVAALRDTLDDGYQIARYAPPRRRTLGPLGYYAVAVDQLDLAVRNTRVLARAVVSFLRESDAVPVDLPHAMHDLARAVEALSLYLERPEHPLDTRTFALEAARRATAILENRNDLETSVLVGQVRSTAFDLLRASGMSEKEALDTFRETTRAPDTEKSVSETERP